MKLGNVAFAAALAAVLAGLPTARSFADPRIIVEHQGVERTATLYRPSGKPTGPAPLIVALHGLGQSVESLHEWLHLDAAADHAGFNVVYPEAIARKWSYGRPIKDPQPVVNGKTVDDVGFIRALLDALVSMKVADPTRIYVTGMSRGGLMTYTLVCALSGRIAAAAPLISGMTDHQREDCRPTRPVPMMVVAGTHDDSQWYDGIIAPAGRLLSIPETMEYWRVKNGCTEEEASWLPHRDESDPTRVRLFEWSKCRNDAQLKLYRVSNGGHQLPSFAQIDEQTTKLFGLRNHDIETADEIAKFVMTASLTKSR
jgi:polyhydroxybutyrate depolymerase